MHFRLSTLAIGCRVFLMRLVDGVWEVVVMRWHSLIIGRRLRLISDGPVCWDSHILILLAAWLVHVGVYGEPTIEHVIDLA